MATMTIKGQMSVSALKPSRSSCAPMRSVRKSQRSAVSVQAVASVPKTEPKFVRPDVNGRYGKFGGKFVPETLIPALAELEEEYTRCKNDPEFKAELASILKDYVGRETPLYYAERLSKHYAKEDGSRSKIFLKLGDLNHTGAQIMKEDGNQSEIYLKRKDLSHTGAPIIKEDGSHPEINLKRNDLSHTGAPLIKEDGSHPEIYLKREDLNHTGAHKINNSLGQAMLCKRMTKKRIIAETGAGQHGVATATVCARLGLKCIIYMGAKDMERQSLNVFRMKLLGAEVRPVHSGTATLKDATSEAIRDWVTNVETTHYILGSAAGPHPYPMMVRDFQSVIGKETRTQCMEKWGGVPDIIMACVGGGSNAMGIFDEFIEEESAGGEGIHTKKHAATLTMGSPGSTPAPHDLAHAGGEGIHTKKHAATLTMGSPGVLHGSFSYLLQDEEGQIIDPHSISAGLDYPGIGPEHSFLKDVSRAEYHSVTDSEALEAFQLVSQLEGIIPALETSHAFAHLEKLCPTLPGGTRIVINCSGRGDKDVNTVIKLLNME
eukprot:gene13851-19774_t